MSNVSVDVRISPMLMSEFQSQGQSSKFQIDQYQISKYQKAEGQISKLELSRPL